MLETSRVCHGLGDTEQGGLATFVDMVRPHPLCNILDAHLGLYALPSSLIGTCQQISWN